MKLSEKDLATINNAIRDIKDFPKEGIVFKDITTLLSDAEAYGVLMKHLQELQKL